MVLPEFKMFKQGAEGKLYRGIYLGKPSIIKERFKKTYRHPVLDESLNKERIKAEARALVRSKAAGVRTPAVYLVDFDRQIIVLEDILNSVTAKDYINKLIEDSSFNELKQLTNIIGEAVGKLHSEHLIHGDLTTSNMLIVEPESDIKLYMIDFGLSHFSQSTEDKGVDLYVLERALLSTHKDSEKIFDDIIFSYSRQFKNGSKEVLSKFEDVRARGRKRTMVG